jgi:hypothetical protein
MIWRWSKQGWQPSQINEKLQEDHGIKHHRSAIYRVIEAKPKRGRPPKLQKKERRPSFWTFKKVVKASKRVRAILKKAPDIGAKELKTRLGHKCCDRTFRILLEIMFGKKPWKPAAKGVVLTKYDLRRRRKWCHGNRVVRN